MIEVARSRVEGRCHHAARRTALRPEVDHYGQIVSGDEGIEAAVIERDGFAVEQRRAALAAFRIVVEA